MQPMKWEAWENCELYICVFMCFFLWLVNPGNFMYLFKCCYRHWFGYLPWIVWDSSAASTEVERSVLVVVLGCILSCPGLFLYALQRKWWLQCLKCRCRWWIHDSWNLEILIGLELLDQNDSISIVIVVADR